MCIRDRHWLLFEPKTAELEPQYRVYFPVTCTIALEFFQGPESQRVLHVDDDFCLYFLPSTQ